MREGEAAWQKTAYDKPWTEESEGAQIRVPLEPGRMAASLAQQLGKQRLAELRDQIALILRADQPPVGITIAAKCPGWLRMR